MVDRPRRDMTLDEEWQKKFEYRKNKAKKLLDEWLDVTGAITTNSSWYHELCSIIDDAVEIGLWGAVRTKEKEDE